MGSERARAIRGNKRNKLPRVRKAGASRKSPALSLALGFTAGGGGGGDRDDWADLKEGPPFARW